MSRLMLILLLLSLLLGLSCSVVLMTTSLASPAVQAATRCNLVYPKYGELIPVNVDQNGEEELAKVWTLIDCAFTTEAWSLVLAGDGHIFIGVQEIDSSDFAVKENNVIYVQGQATLDSNVFVHEMEMKFRWNDVHMTYRDFIFTINTCSQATCFELTRLHARVVKATSQLLKGLIPKPMLPLDNVDDDRYRSFRCGGYQSTHIDGKDQICDGGKDIPKTFDFMEIGTSAFETIIGICKEYHTGISIEPIGTYQDMLPDVPNVHKLRFAVGTVDGYLPLYQIPKAIIDSIGYTIKSDEHRFLYGLGKLNSLNVGQIEIARRKGGANHLHLVQRDLVPIKTIKSIYMENNIHDIKVLKLDCEGMDASIIISTMTYFEEFQKIYPRIIAFEYNDKEYEEMFRKLHSKGYKTYRYLYNVDRNGEDVYKLKFENSNVFAVHETCSQTEIEEYKYMFEDHSGRGLEHAINACVSITGNVSGYSLYLARHCNILTRKHQSRDTDIVLTNECLRHDNDKECSNQK